MSQTTSLVKRSGVDMLAPLYPHTTDRLLYDGDCGLCHHAVNFVLEHDASGSAFRFTPLQAERVSTDLPQGVTRAELPDSVIVITERDEVLVKSDAALYIGKRLGGVWRLLATAAQAIPRGMRDGVYDFIAQIRDRLFAKPEGLCPVAAPDIRARFDY